MANLIIDIGNTALKAAWADGITLGKTFRYQGEKIIDFILSITEKIKPEVIVVSTVRELTKANVSLIQNECKKFVILDSSTFHEYGLPEYISSDRAAAVIAARYLFKGKPCSVFDFGTTLTVDFIDSEGGYSGGNISLGCRTRFKAVNRYSRNLPLLDAPVEIHSPGTSIQSSIQSGVISGIVFEIMGYLAQYPENIVVFTGGDAIYFANKMKISIFVVCNLVLMGLALIADDYEKRNF